MTIEEILDADITTNIAAFRSSKEYTAKLFIKGHLLTESINSIMLETDRDFLIKYLKEVIQKYLDSQKQETVNEQNCT